MEELGVTCHTSELPLQRDHSSFLSLILEGRRGVKGKKHKGSGILPGSGDSLICLPASGTDVNPNDREYDH